MGERSERAGEVAPTPGWPDEEGQVRNEPSTAGGKPGGEGAADAAAGIIAIDGPAGSGKSTVARTVADRLDLPYLDTGAMYRAVAFAALRRGIDPEDRDAVARLARGVDLSVESGVVTVDGVDASIEVRGPEVTRAVSAVAANPDVRAELVARQRRWAAERGGGVVEGRDIGTVVFPAARLKVYLTASHEARSERRAKEASDLTYDSVAADIARRDHADSTRSDDPLQVAADAVVLDTTGLSVDDVVAEVLDRVAQAGAARPSGGERTP
ncbi:MAG: Cytidylate kinase [uncultured Acidimicrobiales bacterium]|uniref:Cytidylate kinase n=1 Tax=uncultured Acidimicrobiales bacterium TaxID=310071 RepID=A0A6J4I539_9ACTN|nr:MAG: Cytidylate kinase [uncultured Acidimicrobiales bacterium]